MEYLREHKTLLDQLNLTKSEIEAVSSLSLGSHKVLSWKCDVAPDHIWRASVKDRASGRGCPFCAGKRTSVSNRLDLNFPEVAAQWHPTNNQQLKASDFVSGSKKKVWWKCSVADDHEWAATIYSQTHGSSCPFCAGKKVSKTNCLANNNPELASEWHPTKNGSLTPNDVTDKSAKKVWWQCTREITHTWQASVGNRSLHSQGCPYCSNKRVCSTNNLDVCFPDIAKQWHPTKNGTLTPSETLHGSKKKVWWQCEVAKDHYWSASPGSRTARGRGCPYCGPSPRFASSTNNLALKYPDLAKQWHPTKNGELTPDQVLTNTTTEFWWLCEHGHHFKSNCNQRVSANVTCPYCSGYRIGQGNSLADKFPDIVAEWDHEKNTGLSPEKLAPSSGKQAWFRCSLGHSYKTIIKNRTANNSGCPKCTKQSSQPELRVFAELKHIFPDAEHKYRIKRVELDIFIPSIRLAIEYDGAYWHREKGQKDRLKNNFCRVNNIKLVRLREKPLKKILETDISISSRQPTKADLDNLLKSIFFKLYRIEFMDNRIQRYLNCNAFQNDALFEEFKTYLPLPHPSKSIAYSHPELLKFWDYSKNHPLEPSHFTSGSNREVFWVCAKGHSYKTAIYRRRNLKGCPVCYANRGQGYRKFGTSKDKNQLKFL